MSAPHVGALASQLPPLPDLRPPPGEATVAVHDEGDHLAAYLAPVPLGFLSMALAQGGQFTAWDALGRPVDSHAELPTAGEAIDGVPLSELPASLRAHPRAVLAAGSDWVLCVEDGIHATLFARRPSVVVRAVQATLAHLMATPGLPVPRIDPRILGLLARPSFRGSHRLRLEPQTESLWIHSPRSTVALAPDSRGRWRLIQ